LFFEATGSTRKDGVANAATQAMHVPDVDWVYDLSGVFDIVTIPLKHAALSIG
jgi:hypothetical protein